MILSDKAIMSLLQEGTLSISPLQDSQIQPASVDIRLGNTFSIVEDSSAPILTFTQEMAYKEMHAENICCCRPGAESDSWFLPGWIRRLCIPTAANIRGSGALRVPGCIWTRNPIPISHENLHC